MATNERIDLPSLSPVSGLAALRARASDAIRFHPREVAALAVLGLLVLVGATLAYVRARPASAASIAPVTVAAEASDAAGAGGAIFVHVVGAVRAPGVYEFAEGARVIDAVRAAGGMTRRADATAVNLARPLADGEQIVVPKRGEPTPASGTSTGGGGSGATGGTININLASAAELDSLPGIGPVLAERIVAYREQHGPFRSVRDLMKVSGIGPKKFESLEGYVTV